MRRSSIPCTGLLFLLLFFLLAPAAYPAEPFKVYTVNYPLAYFTERIAGEQVQVVFPAPTEADPAFWMPDTDTIAAYQDADLILLNGAGYAKWIAKVSLPRRRLVDTSKSFSDRFIQGENQISHSHGPGEEHAHGGVAFTTWLDFDLAVRHAEAIKQVLQKKRPQDAERFEQNFQALRRDFEQLDAEMFSIVEQAPGRKLLASHPVYQYLARRYGLDLATVTWEPDQEPDLNQWGAFRTLHEEHPAEWMLWERAPRPEIRQRLSEQGVAEILFDPGMNRPDQGDFLSVMRRNIQNLREVYTSTPTSGY